MIRAIIFDFDGVLIESVKIKTEAFAKLFEEEGPGIVDQVVAYHLSHGGLTRVEKFRYFYRHILKRELSDDRLQTLCNEFRRLVLDKVVNARLVEGAQQVLEACRRHGVLAFVVSASPQEELLLIVQRRGMAEFFQGIYGSPTTKPASLRYIISTHGFHVREILFVGDALADYNAAREVGVWFVARGDRETAEMWAGRGVHMMQDLRGLPEVLTLSEENTALTLEPISKRG